MTTRDATGRPGGRRDETEDERADRNFADLLQELRVAQTGVQFLFAFLLTLAFTERFETITRLQEVVYLGTLLATAVSSSLLIGPVPLHRTLFRRGLKPRLVKDADRMARGGLAMLLLAINGAVLLILDVVLGGWLPYALAAGVLLWFLLVWYIVPIGTRVGEDHRGARGTGG